MARWHDVDRMLNMRNTAQTNASIHTRSCTSIALTLSCQMVSRVRVRALRVLLVANSPRPITFDIEKSTTTQDRVMPPTSS
mmetsp:Transcript_19910/g.55348  ORF Transcript_19910/g.55348 Transcript_19910/m.55348 type:complete len:81 (+) Transcript_19910:1141-1383(+)